MNTNIIKTITFILMIILLTIKCSDDENQTIDVISISLNKEEVTLGEGLTTQLIAVVNPTDATDKSISWESADPAIAIVDQDGLVTAIAAGQTKVYVRGSQDIFNYCNITVTARIVEVEKITLNETELVLEKDDTFTLIATVEPENASDKNITWESSDPSLVSVDDNGNIVALKAGGSANITARAGDKSARCIISVKSEKEDYPESSYTLSEDNKTLIKWLGEEEHIDMNADSKLKIVETIAIAFDENENLKSISIGNKVTTIQSYAFILARNLTTVKLPDGLKNIGPFAFSECGIQSLNLPDGLTSLGQGVFKASKITSIVLPKSLETVGGDMFHSCSELVSAEIPNSVTELKGGFFYNCPKLEKVKLGNNVQFFEDWSFADCKSLKTFEIATSSPVSIGTDVFWGVSLSAITLKVPIGAAAEYKQADIWRNFGKIEEQDF